MPLTAQISPELLAVQETLAAGLVRVEKAFDRQLRSDLPPVQALCRHVESYRGKMLRPGLVILCGLAAGKGATEVSDEHITIAAVCEMIHMATLVHDDVLDEADTLPSYCNGGIYIVPQPLFQELRETWPRWDRWLLDRPDLIRPFGAFADQISLAMSCEELGLSVDHVPLELNFDGVSRPRDKH